MADKKNFVILKEIVERDGGPKSYKILKKGFVSEEQALQWMALLKIGPYTGENGRYAFHFTPGKYFVGQFSTCINVTEEIVRNTVQSPVPVEDVLEDAGAKVEGAVPQPEAAAPVSGSPASVSDTGGHDVSTPIPTGVPEVDKALAGGIPAEALGTPIGSPQACLKDREIPDPTTDPMGHSVEIIEENPVNILPPAGDDLGLPPVAPGEVPPPISEEEDAKEDDKEEAPVGQFMEIDLHPANKPGVASGMGTAAAPGSGRKFTPPKNW